MSGKIILFVFFYEIIYLFFGNANHQFDVFSYVSTEVAKF